MIPSSLWKKIKVFIDLCAPVQYSIGVREIFRISFGVLFTLLCISGINFFIGYQSTSEKMLLAPFAISALILTLAPKSPMSQPVCIIEAYLLSGAVAFILANLMDAPIFSTALALLISFTGMYFLGCYHPPVILLILLVLFGRITNPVLILSPILVDVVILIFASSLFNRLVFLRK